MKFLDAGKSKQYQAFFMNPSAGRRHLRLGATSTMDDVIMGRDMDFSGADPHMEFMKKYVDHAGKKSGEQNGGGRKPGYAMASEMDTLVWGRDFDKTGRDPRAEFLAKYGDHAGMQVGGDYHRPSKKVGCSMASTMDSVIWGRDFDSSGADMQEVFSKVFEGHAGAPSAHKEHRPFRKLIVGMSSNMDEILTGRDVDGSEDAWQRFVRENEDAAGVRSAQKDHRNSRKPGRSLQSAVDTLVWGTDLDVSGDGFQAHRYRETYGDSAGVESGRMPKSVRRQAAEQRKQFLKQQAMKSSQSSPALGSTLKPSEVQSPQPGSLDYQPPARTRSNSQGSLTARSSPQSPPGKSCGRAASVGALTARGGTRQPELIAQSPASSDRMQFPRKDGASGMPASRSDSDPERAPTARKLRRSSSLGSLTARGRGDPMPQQSLQRPDSSRYPQFPVRSGPQSATSHDIGMPAPAPGRPQSRPPSSTGSVGSVTSRDYGVGCWSPVRERGAGPTVAPMAVPSARATAAPTEKALAAVGGGARVPTSRSQCSTASSSV